MIRAALKIEGFSKEQLPYADVDGDEDLTLSDALLVLKMPLHTIHEKYSYKMFLFPFSGGCDIIT